MSDGGFDLSKILGAEGSPDIGNAVNALLSRPELIQSIAKEIGLSPPSGDTEEKKSAPPPASVPPVASGISGGDGKARDKDRDRLLKSLRPFLTPERQRALDMMMGIGAIGSIVSGLDPTLISSLLGAAGKGGGNV